MAFEHRTVLAEETVSFLDPKPEGVYVDVTLGGGGHTALLLEKTAPSGHVIGCDRDHRALEASAQRLAMPLKEGRLLTVHATISELESHLEDSLKKLLELEEVASPSLRRCITDARVDGILADLGVSSPQLDEAQRGFSFMNDGPLDMRMDPSRGLSAKDWIASCTEEELANAIYQYGEERRSRRVAKRIKEAESEGLLDSTHQLVRAIHRALGPKRGPKDPATRTFQAIRIAVNDELRQLERLLEVAPRVLKPGGRLSIISFHSLEDRLVKRAFKDRSSPWFPLSKKPIQASEQERALNPRARSAKLRAAIYQPE